MKAILAGVIAAATLIGAGAAANADVKVVVKPGYPYYHNGVHYRYMSSGRYYNNRVKVCRSNHHRTVCTWTYR